MRAGYNRLRVGAVCAGLLSAVSCGGGHGATSTASSTSTAANDGLFDACVGGDTVACKTFTESHPVASADRAGMQAAAMCERSSWHGCYFLSSDSRDEVLEQYRSSCVQGSADPCIIAGYAVLRDNEAVAIDLFARGCSQGADHDSCKHIGESLCAGDGITENPKLGAMFFEAACKRNDADACARFGRMLMIGHGVDRDEESAALVLDTACHEGDLPSCRLAGKLFASGRDQYRSESRAASLLSIACDRDDPSACRDLSSLYRNSKDMSVDPARADALLDRACLLGSAGACDDLRVRDADAGAKAAAAAEAVK